MTRRANLTLTPRVEDNPWGQHDRDRFLPTHNFPLRCPKCENLFESGFLEEGAPKCPNCNYKFRKREARDMAVESMQMNMVNRGYNEGALDELARLKGNSGVLGPAGAKPVDSVALELARVAVAKRQATQRRMARYRKSFQNAVYGRQVA